MDIETEQEGDSLFVSLAGRLDSSNAAESESKLLAAQDGGEAKMAVDFSKLDYISSAGLRVILLLAKKARQGNGKLVLFGMQPQIRDVFEISGFLQILKVVETKEEAAAALS